MAFLQKNDFIESYNLRNISLCDDLIKLYDRSDDKRLGLTSKGLERHTKDSIDAGMYIDKINKTPILKSYVDELFEIVNLYTKKYTYSKVCNFGLIEDFNLQYYPVGGGYHGWHTERCTSASPISASHLVFMTYLNDVYSGGGTEFFYQKRKFKARKGKTLIWPADWTHTHRGIASHKEEKYIITGWLSFYTSQDNLKVVGS